jgi:hypothetical protein
MIHNHFILKAMGESISSANLCKLSDALEIIQPPPAYISGFLAFSKIVITLFISDFTGLNSNVGIMGDKGEYSLSAC